MRLQSPEEQPSREQSVANELAELVQFGHEADYTVHLTKMGNGPDIYYPVIYLDYKDGRSVRVSVNEEYRRPSIS